MADSLTTIDYTRLVLSEVQRTVTALTPDLRTFVETADPACCLSIIVRLNAISNTLDLTGVRGARLLVDEMSALLTEFVNEAEMEQTLSFSDVNAQTLDSTLILSGDADSTLDLSSVESAIVKMPDEKAREAHHMLLTAMEKFSGYLDFLKSGGQDRVPALVPLVNNLRACRLSPFLSESLFAGDLFALPEQITIADAKLSRDDSLLASLQSCRLPLMKAVLAICKQRGSDIQFVESLDDIIPLLERLEAATPVGKLQEFWQVARAVCVSVSDGSLQADPAIRYLLVQLERYAGETQEALEEQSHTGDNSQQVVLKLPVTLFRNFLYYTALSDSSDECVANVYERYRLKELLPDLAGDSTMDGTVQPFADTLDRSMIKSLQTEIAEVSALVAEHAAYGLKTPPELLDGAQHMQQVSATFLLLGEIVCEQHAVSSANILTEIASNPDPVQMHKLATALLLLEERLDQLAEGDVRPRLFAGSFDSDLSTGALSSRTLSESALSENAFSENKLSAFQLDKTIFSCLDEARSHLESVEQAYLDKFTTLLDQTISLDSTADTAALTSTGPEPAIKTVSTAAKDASLTDCAKDVDIARQALLIIPLPETTPPLEMVADYLRWCDKLPADVELPRSLHTAFADLVANLLHYLDSHVQAQSGASELLQNAEAAMAWMSHALSLEPSQVTDNDALARVYTGMTYTAAGTVGAMAIFNQTTGDSATLDVSQLDDDFAATADATDTNMQTATTQNIQPHTTDESDRKSGDDFTTNALNRFANISQHLHNWRSTGELSALHALQSEYTLLEQRSRQAEFAQMATLSAANIQLLEHVSQDHDGAKTSTVVNELLQESIAVLPQLLNDTQTASSFDGSSDDEAQYAIPGLHELVTRLETVSIADSVEQSLDDKRQNDETMLESLTSEADDSTHSQTFDVTEQATLDVTEDATLAATILQQPSAGTSSTESTHLHSDATVESFVDDSVADDTLAGTAFLGDEIADQSLFNVFQAECSGHIATLKGVSQTAVLAGVPMLSSDRFANTLHTLCGSALTAEEKDIASIANQLEGFVGNYRRASKPLDSAAWKTVADTVDSLSFALDARMAGASAEDIASPAISRLKNAAAPLTDADNAGASESAQTVDSTDEAEVTKTPPINRFQVSKNAGKQKDLQNQLFLIFTDEADLILGKLQRMHAELEELSTRANNDETPAEQQQRVILRDALRQLHTLKGSARVAGCESMAILSHHIENGWLNWLQQRSEINDRRLDLFEASIDALQISLEQARNGESAGDFDMLVGELNDDLELSDSPSHSFADSDSLFDQTLELSEAADETAEITVEVTTETTTEFTHVSNMQADESVDELNDQTQVIASTTELDATIETQDDTQPTRSLQDENAAGPTTAIDRANTTGGVRVDSELLNQLSSLSTRISMQHAELQQGFTLLGDSLLDLDKASVMLRQKLRDLDLETSLLPDDFESQSSDDANDQTVSLAAAYAEPATATEAAIAIAATAKSDTVFETGSFANQTLANNALATDEDRRQLSEVLHDLDTIRDALHERLRQEGETLSQSSRLTADIHESVLKAKHVRFDTLSQRLHSIVRQAARSLGKHIEFRLHGGEITIDQEIHRQLAAPLEHLLRNAVAHGIELPGTRGNSGKPEQGLIDLHVQLSGNNLKITLRDDGAGVNYKRLRELSGDDTATDAQLLVRLPEQGLSTRQQTDMLSGRGVGLATAHSQLALIQGQLAFTQSDSSGTTISISVPLPVQIQHTAVFEINGFQLGITADCVQSVRPSTAMQAVTGGFMCLETAAMGSDESRLQVGDQFKSQSDTLYQSIDVARIFVRNQGLDNPTVSDEPDTASKLLEKENDTARFLLLDVAGQRACIRLDKLIGFRDLIVHPPGRQLDSLGFYSGVSQQADGTKVLLLDVQHLLESTDSNSNTGADNLSDSVTTTVPTEVTTAVTTAVTENDTQTDVQPKRTKHSLFEQDDDAYNILSTTKHDNTLPAAHGDAGVNESDDHDATRAARNFVDQVDFGNDAKDKKQASKRVMIVDDSVTLRTYTRGVVESRGLKPIDARDGLEALQALKHVQLPPDLLIVDVEMPRMDGFQLVAAIREIERYKKMPVVMISSRTGASYRHRAAKLGVVAYLGKPYYPEELSSILDDLGMITSDNQPLLST